jgi:hypothetical protein
MSPAPTATRDQYRVRPAPLPIPTTDLLLRLAKEIVVDWQMPSDLERQS